MVGLENRTCTVVMDTTQYLGNTDWYLLYLRSCPVFNEVMLDPVLIDYYVQQSYTSELDNSNFFIFFIIFFLLFPFFFLFFLELYLERNKYELSFMDFKFFRFVFLFITIFFGILSNCYVAFFFKIYFMGFCYAMFFQIFIFILIILVYFFKVFEISLLKFFLLLNFAYICLIFAKNLLFIYLVVEVFSIILFFFLVRVRRSFTSYVLKNFYIVNFFSGIFFLFGIYLTYRFLGTLDLLEISNILVEIIKYTPDNFLYVLPFVFLISSILVKFLVFPFYFWAINVYSSFNFLVFILNLTIIKYFYVTLLYKYFYFFFPILVVGWVKWFMFFIGTLSIFLGYFEALYGRNIKEILFFSSVANSGFGILLLSLNLENIFFNLDLFLLFFMVVFFFGFLLYLSIYLFGWGELLIVSNLRNIFGYNPYKALLIAFLFFCYIGFPPFFIFFLKFLIFFTLVKSTIFFLFFVLFIVCWSYLFYLRFFVNIFDIINRKGKGFFLLSMNCNMSFFVTILICFFALIILENFDLFLIMFINILS